jgi:ankyrin repeat protein
MTTENDILRWCSSLVRRRVTGDGIELAHFTVKEYLVSIDSDKDTKFAPFKVDSKRSDKLLGQVCLTYLNLDHLGQYPPPDDIFDNIYSDLESEQTSDFDEYDDMDDENEDSEDTGSDENSHSIDLHDSKQAVFVDKERLGSGLNDQKRSEKTNTKVTADAAFEPYLDKFPLLLYAAGYWHLHLRLYMEDPLVLQLSHKLFDPQKAYQFLWWTYAFMCDAQEEVWERSFPEATTLHWAALLSLPEVCSWLISQGSDVNRTSEMGSPLDCALITTKSLYKWDEDTLIDMMIDKDPPTESSEEMEVVDPTSTTVLRLIQGGAKVDKITSPDYFLVPLEIALVCYPHDSRVINHLLNRGVLITEHALEIVEDYQEGRRRRRRLERGPGGSIPSSIVTIFSEAARKNVSDAAQSIYQRLSVKLTGTIPSKVEVAGISHGESGVADHIGLLKEQFLQASQHGVYKTIESLITTLRNVDHDDMESTLTLGLGLALQNNHENIARLLLESEVNTNLVDEDGDSPAHLAMCGPTDVNITIRNVKNLVKHGADLMIRNKSGELVIHLAAKSKHDTLLKEIVRLMGNQMTQQAVSILRPSLLQYAVKSGADANVTFLLGIYQEINPEDHRSEDGTSLMGLAASRNTEIALRLLQQRGLATDILSRDGSSVLYHAIKNLSERCFNFLMEINTIDNSARSDGRRAIHEAVDNPWKISSSIVAALLMAGEHPNVPTADGSTPLQLHVSRQLTGFSGLDVTLQALLDDERTNIDCRDTQSMTPLMRYSQDLIFLDSERKPGDRAHLLPTMKCLLEHKADVDLIDLNHRTALHHLCYKGVTSASFDFIRLLISSGASLCTKDVDGVTPFEVLFVGCVEPGRRAKYFSQSSGFDPSNVLQFIIDNALDNLNNLFRTGIPPLSFALEWRHTTAADLLLSKEDVSVDIRKTGRDSRTSLEFAASTGCTVDTARALLSRTNKSVYDFHPALGYTLLHFAACDMSDQTVLKQLLQRDIDIEVLNRAAETPLHRAVVQGNHRAVRLLLEAGANTTTASSAPAILPLHLSAQAGQLHLVQALVEFGADVNASSKDTEATTLHYASRHGSWDVVSFLIRMGALINERDVNGATPYVVAAKANHWHIVRKFTKFADLSVPDFDGLGVLHYAILAGSMSLVRFLKKHCSALPQDIRDREGKIGGNELTCAIRSGNIDLFQMFWEDESKTFINDYGSGLAHFAVAASANDVRNLLPPHITEWNLSTANLCCNARIWIAAIIISTVCGLSMWRFSMEIILQLPFYVRRILYLISMPLP